jgi:ABC-type amino acid transport substrate-binding protein
MTTLERIQEEGVLRGGFHDRNAPPAISRDPNTGEVMGFLPDLLRAVTAAIGSNIKAEFVLVPPDQLFSGLAAGDFDIIPFVAHTMEKEIKEPTSKSAFKFGTPSGWTGHYLLGESFFFGCAERDMMHIGECSELRVCLERPNNFNTGLAYQKLRKSLPERHMVFFNTTDSAFEEGLVKGQCNLVAGTRAILKALAELFEDNDDYMFGLIGKTPRASVTLTDDPEFSDFVDSVIKALFAAHVQNITKDRADNMPETLVFGEQYKDMFRDTIRTMGNWSEVHHRSFGPKHPPNTINLPNSGNTGLLLSHPFGQVSETEVPDPVYIGNTIPQIMERGKLRCGVTRRLGFAQQDANGTFTGMDADYCRALAASLFRGDSEMVAFVEVEEATDGFSLLASLDIDVLAGGTWTLQSEFGNPPQGLDST